MKRILLSLVLVSIFVSTADAWPRWRLFRRSGTSYSSASTSYSTSTSIQQIAQNKANIQANRKRCFHPGGSMGGCKYEGVGGGRTAQAALNNCCYSGARGSKGPKRNCVAAATAQASNGWWYACRLYR